MNVAIVYDSSTGTTAQAARTMGKIIEEQGHNCQVQSVKDADPAETAEADLICIGSWIKGLFIIRQHPTAGSMHFVERMGDLSGKKAVVFCTYKVAVGSSMRKMAKALESSGAEVLGQFKFRGPQLTTAFTNFASSLS